MATHNRARYGSILLAVRARLVDFLGWDESRIVITASHPQEVPHLLGDQDIILRTLGESPDRGVIDGGGRVVNGRTRSFLVVLRSRLYLDLSHEDLAHLTDATLGHHALEDAALDALEMFQAVDADDNILHLPMRTGNVTDPVKDRSDPNWISSEFRVEFDYLRDMIEPLEPEEGQEDRE